MFIQFVQKIPQRCGSKLAWARVCMLFGVLNFKYALYALMAWLLHQASKRSWQVRFAGHPKVLALLIRTGDLGL